MADLLFRLESIGPVSSAEIRLAGMTVITGGNNTGKTYLAHSIFGVLNRACHRRRVAQFPGQDRIDVENAEQISQQLDSEGVARLELAPLEPALQELMSRISAGVSGRIGSLFAADSALFSQAEIHAQVFNLDYSVLQGYTRAARVGRSDAFLDVRFDADTQSLIFEALDGYADVAPERVQFWVRVAVTEAMLRAAVPGVFISSAERTGAVIFQRELDSTAANLLDAFVQSENPVEREAMVRSRDFAHPVAVDANIDFIRRIAGMRREPSPIVKANPAIQTLIEGMAGGRYKATGQQLTFDTGQVSLPLIASSSAIRSLVDLNFYILYRAKPGDFLIIDEPELNLHPANQRKLARLLALVHNQGVKVLITTHSDYIVRELSALVSLSSVAVPAPEDVEEVLREQGITRSMALDPQKVKVYSTSATGVHDVPVSDEGIEATSFDDVIDDQNRLVDMVGWAE